MATEDKAPTTGIHPALRGGALVRLGGWAGGAILAVGLMALTAQTDIGSERLASLWATMAARPAVAQVERSPESDAEVRRLETLVLALANDRERLNTRIASLERTLEDTTGSIKQQQANLAAKVAAAASVPPPPAAPPATPAPAPQQQVVPILAPLTMASTVESVVSWPSTRSAPPPAAAPTDAVPLPPARVALLPIDEPADDAPRKPEIGIDLGGASSLEVLNERWTAVKANFGPQLSGLYPRAKVSARSGPASFRLIAGPVPNNATAAQICARFITSRITCRTVRFEGERLVQR